MTDEKDTGKGRLSLRPAGRLELGKTVDAGSVRQSFSHGRSKVVQVEVRKKRGPAAAGEPGTAATPAAGAKPATPRAAKSATTSAGGRALSASEIATRQRVLVEQQKEQERREVERREREEQLKILSAAEEARQKAEAEARRAEEDAARKAEEANRKVQEAAQPAASATTEDAPASRGSEVPARAVPPRPSADRGAPVDRGGYQGARTGTGGAPRTGGYQGNNPRPAGGAAGAPRTGGYQGNNPRPAGAAGAPRTGGYQGNNPRPGGPGAARTPGAPSSDLSATLRLAARGREEPAFSDDRPRRSVGGAPAAKKPVVPAPKKGLQPDDRRRPGRIDVQAAIEGDDEKSRSLASVRRARERERRQQELDRLRGNQINVVRDVIIPDVITVQELANRMAAGTGSVVKSLMKMGVMATATQALDADTAELVAQEFGHRVKRVSESDVEQGLEGVLDIDTDLETRPPVVTIMGHVDHGKTSLLDALRRTDVAAREAGGITQHIGAYQVTLKSGAKIAFIDTPGHEAFTAMRMRGAKVTDIVVLVVAADDGVMPQTIEAIRHAKAAHVPIIVAINKSDKPDANPGRVRTELLSHEIVVEEMGGDTQDVEVSAKMGTGLEKLEEAILLQAEVLDLKANPNRVGEGSVVESRLDQGRGPVATVLVQKGTLRKGDTIVAGAEWGRVRALVNDKGQQIAEAGPSTPVEILGLSGVPSAGEPFVVVENEKRAREVVDYRQRQLREKAAAGQAAARGTLDQMLAAIQAGVQKEVAVVVKADVQGTAEALSFTLPKQANDEVKVRVLHSAVGQITESDVQLAKASNALIVAFNVRATAQARDLARQEGVDIRYYSIIYQVSDDVTELVRGKTAPKARENFLGYAEIRQVFEVTKAGKIAGCRVTEGVVKRGAGVRLLRDNVVIHTGELSTLRRFKDDVREVTNGYECGMSFANYSDIREGDVIECFEIEMIPA